jgi:hypothetical protein
VRLIFEILGVDQKIKEEKRKKNLKRQKNKIEHIWVWLKAGPNNYVTRASLQVFSTHFGSSTI